jgi:lipopolysaccharide transport system ATP-binding protein
MEEPIIQVKGIAKKYVIRHENAPYKTFQETIINAAKAPLNLIKNNGRVPKKETFWALKDITFDVNRGEIIGIIGRNGAGKTTLLKILSRITEPTEGKITLRGRVASLLEVGTGFHPELTGRENIYLNGAVLGMTKKEIDSKFDEIVKFAEVEKFLDTPVKRYSSGMYVRLAFAIAAHLEPEILLVDEVLAVGDLGFQKKCLGKMEDVAKGGRTVLFVSHNMGAIGRLCQRVLLLNQGKLISDGGSKEIIGEYLNSLERTIASQAEVSFLPDASKRIQIIALRAFDHTGKPTTELDRAFPFRIAIEFEVREYIEEAELELILETLQGINVCLSADTDLAQGEVIQRSPGRYFATIEFPGQLLNAGTYRIRVWIRRHCSHDVYDKPAEGLAFHIHDYGSFASLGMGGRQRPGLLAIPLKWTTEEI